MISKNRFAMIIKGAVMTEIPTDELGAMPPPHWFKDKIVYELGNKKNSSGLYRGWYESNKVRHYVCFDWNGEDDAIRIDYGAPLPVDFVDGGVPFDTVGRADLVTNFGFIEHVFTDQQRAWMNFLDMAAKPGCYIASVTPTPGQWEHHGVYQPSIMWLSEFFARNGFLLLRNYINENRRRHVNVICAVRESSPDFHWPEEPIHITNPARRVNKAERDCGVM